MTFVVALVGKGGVGKSTIAALLVRALHERSSQVVMAVDADPNSNLGEKLGVKVGRTIGELREDLLKKAEEIPAGTSKQDHVKYQMQLAKVEGEHFDLLTMGRPEGPGCYCYINNILRTFLDMAMDDYSYVVIDNEAGMEHLSRRTTKSMNALILVSDATKTGVETAVRLRELARHMELKVNRTVLIINRIRGQPDPLIISIAQKAGFDSIELLHEDPEIERLNIAGQPMIDLDGSSPFYRTIKLIAASLV